MRPISDSLSPDALVTETGKRTLVLDFLSQRLRLPPITHFPGNHPVSLSRESLESMSGADWLVSLKADGHRVLLVCIEVRAGVFVSCLVDRNLSVYRYPLTASELHPAVFDAELTDGALWLFDDLLLYNGEALYPRRVRSCLDFARNVVDGKVLVKEVRPAYNAADLYTSRADDMPVDGVVFTHVRAMSNRDFSRRTESLRKWKPVHTVDLFVSSSRQLLWNLGDTMEPVGFSHRVKWGSLDTTDVNAEFEVECRDSGVRLQFVRLREHTNHKSTVLRSLESAREALDIVSVSAVLEASFVRDE